MMEQESYKRLLILEMLPILLCVWCCWAPRLTVYVCMYECKNICMCGLEYKLYLAWKCKEDLLCGKDLIQ